MSKKRRLGIQTRSDLPFEIYLPSDEGVSDLNTPDQIDAYNAERGGLIVDETCTPFLIKAVSYRDAQTLKERLQSEHGETLNLATRRALQGGAIDAGTLGDDEMNIYLKAAEVGLKMRLEYVKLGFMGVEGMAAPAEGWASLLDPESETGFGSPEERKELAEELGLAIQRAAELGPKAGPFFKRRYGSQTTPPAVEPLSPGHAQTVTPKIETSEEAVEAPSGPV